MKKLLFVFLLISPFSFADWGDVYYCQMTSLVVIKADGTVKEYEPEKFQFKLDEARNSMVFGKGGYFNNTIEPLDPNWSLPSDELWTTSDNFGSISYKDGKFLSTFNVISEKITNATADCDRFE